MPSTISFLTFSIAFFGIMPFHIVPQREVQGAKLMPLEEEDTPTPWSGLTNKCPDGRTCPPDELCTIVQRKDTEEECVPATVKKCDQYLDYERRANCGPKGYLLGLGFKYCSRFYEHYANFTEEGQKLIDCTGQCLLNDAEDYFKEHPTGAIDCSDLKRSAYKSHPKCYVQCGFCSAIKGNIHAYLDVVDFNDLAWREVTRTLVKCLLIG